MKEEKTNIYPNQLDQESHVEEPNAVDKLSLKEQTVKNLSIVGSLQIVNKIVSTITGIILARLLMPSDFGVVAIGMLLFSFMNQFGNMGIGTAVIYRKDKVETSLSTGFVMRFFLGLFLFIVVFFVAPFWARFYNNLAITNVTRIIALSMIVTSLGFVPSTRLTKELRFTKLAISELTTAFIHPIVAITMAFLGFGYWSLVWGSLISQIAGLVVLCFIAPFKIKFNFDKDVARELWRYGKHVFAAGFVGYFLIHVDDIAIGKMLGVTALGYYRLAYNWGNFVATDISKVVGRVAFPTYSKIQDDFSRLRRGYLEWLKYISFIAFPISFGLFAIAPDFVRLILGEKWIPATVPLQILCFFGLLRAVATPGGSILQAIGRPDITFKVNIVFISLICILLFPLMKLYGIIGASLAVLIAAIVNRIIGWLILKYLIQLNLAQVFRMMVYPFIASALMVGSIYFVSHIAKGLPGLYYLVSLVFIGGVVYLICTLITMRKDLIYISRLAFVRLFSK